MRKIRPCFPGISLQRGVQAVAVIDILCSVIFEILTLVALVQCIKDEETCSFTPPANSSTVVEPEHIHRGVAVAVMLSGFIVVGLLFLLDLLLSCYLLQGATKESVAKLKRWWWIEVFLFALNGLFIIVLLAISSDYEFEILDFLETIFRGYALWIVAAYIKDLQDDAFRARSLGDEEILTDFAGIERNPMTSLDL